MQTIYKTKIIEIISQIMIPNTSISIVERTSNIVIQNNEVYFYINTNAAEYQQMEEVKKDCENKIKLSFPNIKKISISLVENKHEKKTDSRHEHRAEKVRKINGVNKILVVASGKGGVGKSTVAANIAIMLANHGYNVGLVDADIYGPSVAKLFGVNKKPVLEDNKMIPHEKFGVKLMSIGFLIDEDAPTVWRGPMVTKMLYQLLNMTNWNYDGKNLDYLIVDTPPGTGDVHLSLAENYDINGALIVTTPQELATIDAKKAIVMFEKVEIPVIGIVENMSHYVDDAGNKIYIFGKGGGEKMAKKHKVKLLASIPLDPDLLEASDKAKPLTYYKDKSKAYGIFEKLIKEL
jgi:ATP-binding protein involved in chromosome partitioning